MTRIQDMMLTVASVTGMLASGAAAMTIWLLLTQPLTVANAVNTRDLAPLAQAIADAIFAALTAIVRYL